MKNNKALKIPCHAVRKNKSSHKPGFWWKYGGCVLIEDDTVIIDGYDLHRFVFDRSRVSYYRDTKEELLLLRIIRIFDDEKDFSVQLSGSDYNRFMKAMQQVQSEG